MAGTLIFDETMSGFYSPASTEPSRGFAVGRQRSHFIRGSFRITVDNVDRFILEPAHEAKLEGALDAKGLGEGMEVQGGRFNLFRRDEGGVRHMTYRFNFSAGGQRYRFEGQKEILDDPTALDAVEDMTTLYTRIYRPAASAGEEVGAAGILRFHLRDLPLLLASIRTPDDSGLERLKVVNKFFAFAYGELAQTYLLGLK